MMFGMIVPWEKNISSFETFTLGGHPYLLNYTANTGFIEIDKARDNGKGFDITWQDGTRTRTIIIKIKGLEWKEQRDLDRTGFTLWIRNDLTYREKRLAGDGPADNPGGFGIDNSKSKSSWSYEEMPKNSTFTVAWYRYYDPRTDEPQERPDDAFRFAYEKYTVENMNFRKLFLICIPNLIKSLSQK